MSSPPSSPPLPLAKKRRRLYSLSDNLSSDPVFSSDDLQDASVEQYDAPRKKRNFRGPWWKSSQETVKQDSAAKQKASFVRNFDSGVWMGSDDSDLSLPSLPEIPGNEEVRVQGFETPHAVNSAGLSFAELRAKDLIDRYLEANHEFVDLSNLGLDKIDSSLIRALQTLSVQPALHGPPSPSEYRSLTPSLHLFLANNSLTRLPNEFWQLENLTILSLRDNCLSQLSPAVSKLKKLKTLNVTGNGLRYLPWELLSLLPPHGRLTTINLEHGNKFLLPFDAAQPYQQLKASGSGELDMEYIERMCEEASAQYLWLSRLNRTLLEKKHDISTAFGSDDLEVEAHTRRIAPILVGATRIKFFNIDGSVVSERLPTSFAATRATSGEASSLVDIETMSDDQTFVDANIIGDLPNVPGTTSGAAPSLLEVALRTATTHLTIPELRSFLPQPAPRPIELAMREAEACQSQGGRDCSVCGRYYMIPRAEWIEFWHCGYNQKFFSMNEVFLPFLRRACSWACSQRVWVQLQKGREAGVGQLAGSHDDW